MLAPPGTIEPTSGMAALGTRARGSRRARVLGEGELKDGLSLGSLRATSGPPGVLSAATSSGESATSILTQPLASGQGLLSQLQAQVQEVSPLTARLAGSRSPAGQQPRSLGVLQAEWVKAQQDFRRLDQGIRQLQATRNPFRERSGFAFRLLASALDLVG